MEFLMTTDEPDNYTGMYDSNTTLAATLKPQLRQVFGSGQIYDTINFYSLWVLVVVGVVCNCLSFAVFMRSPSMKRTTTGHYLIALTVADMGVVLAVLCGLLDKIDVTGKYYMAVSFQGTKGFCIFRNIFIYVCTYASSWLTVAITFERFLTVRFPLKIIDMSTTFKAKIVIASIWILSIAVNMFPIWTLDIYKPGDIGYCSVFKKKTFNRWIEYQMFLTGILIPCILVLVFTMLIIYYLKKASAKRMKQFPDMKQGNRKTTEAQLTRILLSVAIAMLVLKTPFSITYYLQFNVWDIWVKATDEHFYWVKHILFISYRIAYIFNILNYVLNFFLYYLCGSTFRNNFVKMFKNIGGRGSVYKDSSTNVSSTIIK